MQAPQRGAKVCVRLRLGWGWVHHCAGLLSITEFIFPAWKHEQHSASWCAPPNTPVLGDPGIRLKFTLRPLLSSDHVFDSKTLNAGTLCRA